MSQMDNLARFIRSHYDVAGAPLLAIILIILEKLMETEFTCPIYTLFGIIYSLTFILGTTAILIVLVNSCQCHNRCGTCYDEDEDTEQVTIQNKETKCNCYCIIQAIINFVKNNKASIFWFLILVTDGRYVNCLVESIRESNANVTTEVKGFVLQIIQVIGILLILIFVIILLRKWETKSKRYENKHRGTILEYTQEALQEHKKQRLQAFVKQTMKVEDWDPTLLNAEERWEKITDKCRNNVEQTLREEAAQKQPGCCPDVPLKLNSHERSVFRCIIPSWKLEKDGNEECRTDSIDHYGTPLADITPSDISLQRLGLEALNAASNTDVHIALSDQGCTDREAI